MIEAAVLGMCIWGSLLFSWMHSPKWFKKFTLDHPMATDFISVAIVYIFLSTMTKAFVAAAGAVVGGLLTSLSLFIGSKYNENSRRNGSRRLEAVAKQSSNTVL